MKPRHRKAQNQQQCKHSTKRFAEIEFAAFFSGNLSRFTAEAVINNGSRAV
jgi:hypothetical protein